VLFGVEGLQVTDAQALPDGTLEVWAVTGHPAAAACPDCGTVSARRHDTVLARPRDVRRGGDADRGALALPAGGPAPASAPRRVSR
jgi:hypothetical protein